MMGLFDFIKKNPSVDTSRLPEFENYGQSPESFSNFQFSRSNQGVKPDKTKVEQPVTPVSSAEQVRAATNQAMQEQTEKKPTTPDDVFTALLRERYQESEDSLKRQRAAEFWGNLANLFGQTVSSAAGARMFSPIKSNTQQYNQAIDRLRDSYNDTLLNYNLSTARAERAAKAEQDKINLKFERDKAIAEIQANLKAGLIDKQKAADLEKQARKAKDAKELEGVKNDFRMKLARYNQGAATGRTKMNNEAAMEREKYRQQEIAKRNGNAGSSSGKKKKYPRMKFGQDGILYDLNNDTDVARMYNEGVVIGYFPKDLDKMTIDEMRQAILTSTDDVRKVSSNRKKTSSGKEAPYITNENKTPWL
jgi:hypothetical protein